MGTAVAETSHGRRLVNLTGAGLYLVEVAKARESHCHRNKAAILILAFLSNVQWQWGKRKRRNELDDYDNEAKDSQDSENEGLNNSDAEGDVGQQPCSAQSTSRIGNTSKRADVARRIKRDKFVSNSTVKVSLGAFLTDEGNFLLKFETILEDMNRGVSECYDLLNYHVLRLCAEGRVVPPFERNFICRFFYAVTVGRRGLPRDPDIMESLERYTTCPGPERNSRMP
ncbi:hypothetical protein PC120_g10155 [Phytophthora cactorum]|nr:hypothetical protein PC120_g10155 [Phytophthora cactorum]